MNDTFDDRLSLNQAVRNNAIDAEWFLPFTINRLQRHAPSQQLIITVTLRAILAEPVVVRRLLLTWETNTLLITPPPVQETVITEWAACGIACVVLPFYTQLQIVKVTESGDRFDYWVGDGHQLYGLEVSGLWQGSLVGRKRMKTRQLLDNPFGVGGYVCIVHFGEQSVDLSFHQP